MNLLRVGVRPHNFVFARSQYIGGRRQYRPWRVASKISVSRVRNIGGRRQYRPFSRFFGVYLLPCLPLVERFEVRRSTYRKRCIGSSCLPPPKMLERISTLRRPIATESVSSPCALRKWTLPFVTLDLHSNNANSLLRALPKKRCISPSGRRGMGDSGRASTMTTPVPHPRRLSRAATFSSLKVNVRWAGKPKKGATLSIRGFSLVSALSRSIVRAPLENTASTRLFQARNAERTTPLGFPPGRPGRSLSFAIFLF